MEILNTGSADWRGRVAREWRPRLLSAVFLLLAGMTVWGNYRAFRSHLKSSVRLMTRWEGRAWSSNGPYVNEAREVAAHIPPGAELVFLTSLSKGVSSIGRSTHIGLSWAVCPDRVAIADSVEGLDDAAFLLTSNFAFARFDDSPKGYTLVTRTEENTALWRKEACGPLRENSARNVSVPKWREATGLLAPVAVLVGGVYFGGWAGALLGLLAFTLGMVLPPAFGMRPAPWFVALLAGAAVACVRFFFHCPVAAGLCVHYPVGFAPAADGVADKALSRQAVARAAVGGALVFAVVAVLTLGHTFFAPNGLGVYGGKARLLYLAQGVPPGFFTDPARATLQPAYPPGFALLTLGCYGLAGGCGEWLTQLLGCLFLALAVAFLARFTVSWWCLAWVASAFCTSQVFQMGSLFYAEPLMWLMMLAGWERVRTGRGGLAGWLLLGAAGWIKNEGLLVLPVCWFAVRVFSGRGAASVRHLLAGLALPLLWHIGCRLAGGGLYDYGAFWQPDSRQAMAAAGRVLRLAFREPWRYGCVYPLVVLGWLLPSMRTRPFAVAAVTALVMLAAFAGVFSLSRAGDFTWHLDSMERLLWMPALLLSREVLDGLRSCAIPPP